jgi:hypothetical protein
MNWTQSMCRVILVIAIVGLLFAGGGAGNDDRDRLKSLTPEQADSVKRNQERFNKMSLTEQQRVRSLHENLKQHKHSTRLTSLLSNYASWLRNLPAGQRAELLSLPSQERITKIREIIKRQEQERFRRLAADNLTNEDRQALFNWARSLAASRKDLLLEKFPETSRARYDKASEGQQSVMLAFSLLRSNDDLNLELTEYNTLADTLSDSAKQALKETKDIDQKMNVVREWLKVAWISRWSSFGRREPVSKEKLTEFHDKLSENQREYLNSLPSDRMKGELEQFYHSRFFGGRRGPGSRGGGRQGPGGFGSGGRQGPGGRRGEPAKNPLPPTREPDDKSPTNSEKPDNG